MKFNNQQKSYLSKVSKELVEKVKIYFSSIPDSDNLPNEHYISIESNPNPELFWNEKFCFGINLRFSQSISKHVFMDIEVILWDKFVKVSTGIADEDFTNFLALLDNQDVPRKVEEEVYCLIDRVESI